MKNINQNIIDNKIKNIIYSELNHKNGKFYFKGFDTFDTSINILMTNGFWWHLSWKEDDFFEIGDGKYINNNNYKKSEIKTWKANDRWKSILNKKVIDIKIQYFDEEQLFVERIDLHFENKERKSILILEELNLNESISKPIHFDLGGEIYIFHNQNLIE